MSAADTSTRLSKRARPSPEQDFSLNDLERHPEFWFDDGNISILVAQHTGFRVYRGLLTAQSTVFADMFVASSSTAQEALEGCPVVHLTDSFYDLANLLRVLLPTSPTRYRTAEPGVVHTFDEIFAMVRLAHKYYIQSVQDEELRALQEYYLTSDIDVHFSPLPKRRISIKHIHFIGAVNLARLTDTPLMLPLALHHCCYLGGKLLDGWTREDGFVERLSNDDFQRCVNARHEFGRQELLVVARIFDVVPRERCKDRGRCAPVIAEIAHQTMHEDTFPPADALWGWSAAIGVVESLCAGCKQVLCERDKAERRRIWNALPRILGITVDGWGTPDDGEGMEAAG